MRERLLSLSCDECHALVEVEIAVESYGCPGGFFEPAEGANWCFVSDRCPECGAVMDEEAHQDAVQRILAEPCCPYDDV